MARKLGSRGRRVLHRALGMLAGLALACVPLAVRAVPQSPEGQWMTQERGAVIDIEPCGTSLCGRIAGIADWPANGSVPVDVHGHPQCGLAIITDVRPGSASRWAADITDPENGHVYDAQLWVGEDGQLHVRGYIGLPLFGETQVWTPYTAPVPMDCRLG